MTEMARHTYGDWMRTKSGHIGVLSIVDMKNYMAKFKHINGVIEEIAIFDYDLITEHDFYKKYDPSKCGPDIMHMVADLYKISQQGGEDWFTGGRMNHAIKAPREDLFACVSPSLT